MRVGWSYTRAGGGRNFGRLHVAGNMPRLVLWVGRPLEAQLEPRQNSPCRGSLSFLVLRLGLLFLRLAPFSSAFLPQLALVTLEDLERADVQLERHFGFFGWPSRSFERFD